MSKHKKKKNRSERHEGGRNAQDEVHPDFAQTASSLAADGDLPHSDDRGLSLAKRFALALICAVIAFAVFAPTLNFDFVDWDDTGVLLKNEHWRGLGGEQVSWMFTTNHYGHYQPITWLTYGLDYVIWEMNPRGYHLTNVVFHAANALLVWFLAFFLLKRAIPSVYSSSPRGPWLIAGAATFVSLAFAAHPLRVESVAWVTERRDLVSAFFILLTVMAYLRSTMFDDGRRYLWLGIALVIYSISMLSKVGGAPLPLVLLVLDWFPLKRVAFNPLDWFRTRSMMVILEKTPFLIISLGFSIATIQQQHGRWLIPLEQHDLVARTAQAFYGIVFYIWKTIIPTGLSPLYELRFPLDPFETRFILCAAIVMTAAVIVLSFWKRLAGLIAAGACYALMVGPLLGYFQNGYQIVADRYTYLSTLGWVMLAAGLGAMFLARQQSARVTALVAAIALAAIATLATLTVRQSMVWENTATLWTAVVEHDPDSSFGNNSYGYVLMTERGEVRAAEQHFRRALEMNPDNREALFNLADALRRQGANPVESYEQALQYNDRVPDLWNDYANALFRMQRFDQAADAYRTAIRLDRSDARFHSNLGLALTQLGEYEDARNHHLDAIALDPQYWIARERLATVYIHMGQYSTARRILSDILRDNPTFGPAQRRMHWLNQNHPESR